MAFTRIKGLSDKRRLPRLGKIRLGIKKRAQSGKEYPVEVDYFVCPPEVKAVYGEQPKEIDVYLPVNEQDVVFPQSLSWYGKGGRLKCRGDRERALRVFRDVPDEQKKNFPGKDPGDLVEIPCPCPLLDSGECKSVGILNVILPRVSLGGVYQLVTSSHTSIVSINSDIDYYTALIGRVAMVPFRLVRRPELIPYEDKAPRTHYILKLLFAGDIEWLNKVKESSRILAPAAFALPPPPEIEPDDITEENGEEENQQRPAGGEKEAAKTAGDLLSFLNAAKTWEEAQAIFRDHIGLINRLPPDEKPKLFQARDRLKATAAEMKPPAKEAEETKSDLARLRDRIRSGTLPELEAINRNLAEELKGVSGQDLFLVTQELADRLIELKQSASGQLPLGKKGA